MKITAIEEDDRRPVNTWNPNTFLCWATLDEDCQLLLDTDCEWPAWLEYEIDNLGSNAFFDVEDDVAWALEQGFIPDQDILIRISRPVYSTDYYGEWDVDYGWEVAGFEPVPVEDVVAFWEEWLGRGQIPGNRPAIVPKCSDSKQWVVAECDHVDAVKAREGLGS